MNELVSPVAVAIEELEDRLTSLQSGRGECDVVGNPMRKIGDGTSHQAKENKIVCGGRGGLR